MKFKESLDALALAALAQGPAHGYEVAKRIRSQGGRRFQCGDSRLYPVLHRLEEMGALQSHWEVQEGVPNRKVYMLSDTGKRLLQQHRLDWQDFATAVSDLLNQRNESGNA